MTALANLITESALEELAGDRSFERGLAYFHGGAVERLVSHKNRINARVAGTEVYAVKLWPDGHRLGWNCSCPMGQDGEFCKHLVATGLAWLAALNEVIRKAFASSGFVDYHRMPEVARRAAAVSEILHELSKRGDAKAAAELSADGFGFFSLENYRPALGKEGLAAYRKLAETAWKKIPPRQPDSRDNGDDHRRYQLTEIMKTLARLDNDTNALIEVLRRDLTEPYTYLQIAEALAKAKRYDEALNWAEAGRSAFKNQMNVPLDDFLVAEYHRRKRHDDAIALRWSCFIEHPGLQAYQQLQAASVTS